MAADEVGIYNMALSALGTRAAVAATNEGSPEANACSTWYEPVRDQVFRAAPWPSLTGVARLAVKAERDDSVGWATTDPEPGWRFSYLQPSDMIRPRSLADFSRFKIGLSADNTKILLANGEQAILTYTRQVKFVNLWDIDLQQAVAFALAAHVAKKITGNLSDVNAMFSLAGDKIATAREHSANENNFYLETTPEWLAARGYADNAPVSRYIFPNADFSLSGFGNVT